jgi:phasin family protein
MTTQTSERKSAAAPGIAPGIEWADVTGQWFKAYRTGFDTLLAVSNAMLAGAERMQMTQLEADVETQTRNRTAALAVGDCRDVQGLLALQSNLATAYLESATRYGTNFAQLAQQTHAEIAKLLTARYDEWNRFMRGALPAGVAPESMQHPFALAFEATRASQEAMIKSFASLASMAGTAQKRAA